MFNIETEIGNFGNFKDLYLEMKYTGTKEVNAKCTYCFDNIGELKKLTIEELERLAAKNQLDNETNEIIKKLSK